MGKNGLVSLNIKYPWPVWETEGCDLCSTRYHKSHQFVRICGPCSSGPRPDWLNILWRRMLRYQADKELIVNDYPIVQCPSCNAWRGVRMDGAYRATISCDCGQPLEIDLREGSPKVYKREH